jgi:RNA polymerase sigma-70 factor, ECF subfamily
LVLWRKFDAYKPDTDFFRWAYRTAHLEAMNFLRTRRSQSVLLSEELLAELAEEHLAQVEKYDFLREQLVTCIEKLTKNEREIIQRYYGDEECARNVALQIGQKVNTFYHALKRIRLALFNCLQRALSREER